MQRHGSVCVHPFTVPLQTCVHPLPIWVVYFLYSPSRDLCISALTACCLIALDKCPGVRPIGVGETLRRLISKATLRVTRDIIIQKAVGNLQLCAGQKAACEAGIHAMRGLLESEETEAVILVYAFNAFNSLNREAALRNGRIPCHVLATDPMEHAREKCASSWLITIQMLRYRYNLNRQAFRDALCLRFGWTPTRLPQHCLCGHPFSADHALSCPKGAMPSIRHNSIRDITAVRTPH